MADTPSLAASLLGGDRDARRPWVSGRLRGYVLALLAGLAVSPDAALLRFIRKHSHRATKCGGIDAHMCNIHMLAVLILLKYSLMGSLQLGFVVWESGGFRPLAAAMRSSWRPLVIPSFFMLVTQIGFTISLLETTAANAIMFISLNPLWAAIMGYFFLHDRVARHTLVAMAVAAAAVAFAFLPTILHSALPAGALPAESAEPKGASEPTLHGNLIALATGASLATFITGSRAGSISDPNAPMSAAPALGSLGAALVVAPFALFWVHRLTDLSFWSFIGTDAFLEACYDVGMGLAAQHITGAEVALVLLMEIPLGPFFVFCFFGEVPPSFTIIGCVVLLVALVWHGIVEARSEITSRSRAASCADRLSALPTPPLSAMASPAGSEPRRLLSRPASFVAVATGPRRVYSYHDALYSAAPAGTSPRASPFSARPLPTAWT